MTYTTSWTKDYHSIAKMKSRLKIKNKTDGTIEQAIIAVKQFIDFQGIESPDKFLVLMKDSFDLDKAVESFVTEKMNQGLSSKTIRHYVKAVEKFLQLNDLEVHVKESILPEGRNKQPLSDRAPKREELKNLMNHAYIRDKTIIEVASSSGLRVGTLLSLQVKDVDFATEYACISVAGGDGRNLLPMQVRQEDHQGEIHKLTKPEITFNGKKVEKLEIHWDGERMWLRAIFPDGTKEDTMLFQGGV